MQIEAALFVLIALHFQTSTQGLLKPESESAKFSVGAALRYLSTAIYTKALLQGKLDFINHEYHGVHSEPSDNDPDKLFENAMMSASREDSDECVKRLLCELQGRLDDELSWDERLIKKSVTPSNDYAASYPQFQFAAYLGERQGSEKCNVVYTR